MPGAALPRHAADRYGDECLGSGESPANDSRNSQTAAGELADRLQFRGAPDLGEAARCSAGRAARQPGFQPALGAQRGVCRAYVTRLELVELYLDTAISAAHAMRHSTPT